MEYTPFGMSLEMFLSLTDVERVFIKTKHYMNNRLWVYDKLEEIDADWLTVDGNSPEIIIFGNMDNFPTMKDINEMAEESGKILVTYSRPEQKNLILNDNAPY